MFFFFAILIFDFEMPTWVLVLINLLNDVSAMATSLDKVHSSQFQPMLLAIKYALLALHVSNGLANAEVRLCYQWT